MKSSVVGWWVWGILTMGFVADRLMAWARTYRATQRRFRTLPPKPAPPRLRLSDRGWKEQVYALPTPSPGPDQTTRLYQQMLKEMSLRNDGVGYEQALLARFTAAGWVLRLTPRSGDYGADLVGTDVAGRQWVLQAKDWQAPVGVHAVQEVFAAKGYYHAHGAMVISTHGFTLSAHTLAQRLGVQLVTITKEEG